MILTLLSYAAVAMLAAALLACVARRWQFAASVSRAVVVAGPLVLIASAAVSIVAPLTTGDPATKAVALSQGVSEVITCEGIALAASLVAAPAWGIARWRLRVATRR